MECQIDPKTLAKIKDMPLIARTVAEGFLHGNQLSIQRGVGIEFNQYRKDKNKQVEELKTIRKRNIVDFLTLLNPIIEKYMSDNSIYMLIDKKNVFIAKKDYDITNDLIEIINNQIKNFEIK